MTNTRSHQVRWIAAFAMLSWLGAFVHNMADLPGLAVLSSENGIPALITFALFVAWWKLPHKRLTVLVWLGWVFLTQFLGGGILSVIPLDFWPWDPPQTPFHYFMHAMYTLAQVPLMIALVWQLKQLNQNKSMAGAAGAEA